MPWRASSTVDTKVEFVLDRQKGLWTMSELCDRYGISRESGYETWRRFQQRGLAGLAPRGHEPERHPNQMPEEIAAKLVALRREHPSWGPRKLIAYLRRRWPQTKWPAASTAGQRLKREGLVVERKKRRKTPPYTQPFAATEASNHLWCADFKGWFRTRDGARIDPLTMTDAFSRYLLRCQHVDRGDTEHVQAVFATAFREYGMPLAVRTDNGPPFASRGIAGLSRLSVFLIKLGIVPERIQPGHPEQNGRHERMHRTMAAEVERHPQANRGDQQRALNRFREEYNHERPHEALGQQTPASRYQASPRPFPQCLPVPEYDTDMHVRSVFPHGDICWKSQRTFLSETLAGERVGLRADHDRFYTVFFAHMPIACFDVHTHKIVPLSRKEELLKR